VRLLICLHQHSPAEPPPQIRLQLQRTQLKTKFSIVTCSTCPTGLTEHNLSDNHFRPQTEMANANNVNDSFQAAFDTAIHDFRVKIKNEDLYREILQTKTIEEVYDVTDKLQEEQSRTGRLRHMSKIYPFLEGLRGYSNVIETFVQAKADVLALI
jgi:hypothetical protein